MFLLESWLNRMLGIQLCQATASYFNERSVSNKKTRGGVTTDIGHRLSGTLTVVHMHALNAALCVVTQFHPKISLRSSISLKNLNITHFSP